MSHAVPVLVLNKRTAQLSCSLSVQILSGSPLYPLSLINFDPFGTLSINPLGFWNMIMSGSPAKYFILVDQYYYLVFQPRSMKFM
jgi:hypothetical protein